MTPPIRIQRRRTKGFNLQAQSPDGRQVISVTRPGKWGNPFKCVGDQIFVHAGHRRKILDPWVLFCFGGVVDSVRLFELTLENDMAQIITEYAPDYLGDARIHADRFADQDAYSLKGKHMACFCKIGDACHADALLKYVNQ